MAGKSRQIFDTRSSRRTRLTRWSSSKPWPKILARTSAWPSTRPVRRAASRSASSKWPRRRRPRPASALRRPRRRWPPPKASTAANSRRRSSHWPSSRRTSAKASRPCSGAAWPATRRRRSAGSAKTSRSNRRATSSCRKRAPTRTSYASPKPSPRTKASTVAWPLAAPARRFARPVSAFEVHIETNASYLELTVLVLEVSPEIIQGNRNKQCERWGVIELTVSIFYGSIVSSRRRERIADADTTWRRQRRGGQSGPVPNFGQRHTNAHRSVAARRSTNPAVAWLPGKENSFSLFYPLWSQKGLGFKSPLFVLINMT